MRYLLFVSSLFCLFISCSSTKQIVSKTEDSIIPFWTTELLDNVKRNDFRMILSSSKTNISGIYVVKQVNREWRGSIINEFGIKALDFISTSKESNLQNVIPFLNKWYIKKVIASDIQFIMEIDNPDYSKGIQSQRYFISDTLTVNFRNKKELQRLPDGEIKYKNHKYALTYSLKKIYETER